MFLSIDIWLGRIRKLQKVERLLMRGLAQTLALGIRIWLGAFALCHRGSIRPGCRASPGARVSSLLSRGAWSRCPPSPYWQAVGPLEGCLWMLLARIKQLPDVEVVGQHSGKDSNHRISQSVLLIRKTKATARLSLSLGQRWCSGLREVLQCSPGAAYGHHDLRHQAELKNHHEDPVAPGSRWLRGVSRPGW